MARRLAVAGALGELAAANAMERRLGLLAQPYKNGKAARPSQLAKAFVAFGAATLAAAGRSRTGTVLGSLAVLIGSVAQRLAVLHAGRESAEAAF